MKRSDLAIAALVIAVMVALIVALAGPSKAATMSKPKPTTRAFDVVVETTVAPWNTRKDATLSITVDLHPPKVAGLGDTEVLVTLERRHKCRMFFTCWRSVSSRTLADGQTGVWPNAPKSRYRASVALLGADLYAERDVKVSGVLSILHSGNAR